MNFVLIFFGPVPSGTFDDPLPTTTPTPEDRSTPLTIKAPEELAGMESRRLEKKNFLVD